MASETLEIIEAMLLGSDAKIDVATGIVRDIKILGAASANGRTYPPDVMAKAVKLYEGAKVNVDHDRADTEGRKYAERFGAIRGVRLTADGLRGDLHYNPKHPVAEQFAWDVQNAPQNCGFSHHATIRVKRDRTGGVIVEEIQKVKSVDLVANPATTAGVFEDADPLPSTGRSRSLAALADDVFAFVEPGGKRDKSGRTSPLSKRLWPLDNADSIRSALNSIPSTQRLSADDRGQALARATRAAAKFKIKLSGAAGASTKEGDMSLDTVTLESLRAERPDLLEALAKESVERAELTEAKARIASLVAENLRFADAAKDRELADAIECELREAGIDPAYEQYASKVFRRQLQAAPTATERAELIADRLELLNAKGLIEGTEGEQQTAKEAAAPRSKIAGTISASAPKFKDSKEFASFLRRKA